MKVEEAAKLKLEAEEKIDAIVNDLTKKTGCRALDLDYNEVFIENSNDSYMCRVYINLSV